MMEINITVYFFQLLEVPWYNTCEEIFYNFSTFDLLPDSVITEFWSQKNIYFNSLGLVLTNVDTSLNERKLSKSMC